MGSGPLLTAFSIVLFLAIVFFGRGVRLYTDWLWFADAGYLGVFFTELKGRIATGGGLALAAFLWILPQYWIARSFRAAPRPVVPDDWLDFPQRHLVLRRLDRVFPAALAVLCAFAALGLSGWWTEVLQYRYHVPFGVADPLFGRDVGFYVFRLPLLRGLLGLVPVLLALGALAAALPYALQRDVQLGDDQIHVSRPVQAHLAVLAGLFFVWKAAAYRLDMYDLLFSTHGVVFGATYADVHARLPALQGLTVAALLAALACLAPMVSANRRAWGVPAVFAGLWLAVWGLGWMAAPHVVQRFKVVPNEIVSETPYIQRNIEATRRAYGLADVVEKPFNAVAGLDAAALRRNESTLKNVRLWDHRPLLSTFGQLQEIRTYYKFVSVDNDRYLVDGDYRQVMLSVREMDHKSLPSRIWINEHLTYTHGYGLVLGPVNEVSGEGLPQLFVRDIPPVSDAPFTVARPEIYFGEVANDYVIVNTRSKELDYPAGDQNVYSEYAGRAGVPLTGFLRKLAFALRFGTLKILLSRDVTSDSRVLFHRQVVDRVRHIAPFFVYDRDPYPVLSDGRIRWIVDGYTWSSRYPYSQPTQGSLNYLRNSVKAVVDAYDGTVDFYLMDAADPIVLSYGRIFPGLLKPLESMPADLRDHLRYPQDLFEVQASVYHRYHMTDPQVFYNQEDLWTTPNEILESSETRMEPYYTLMRLPGEERQEYVLMQPFTPRQKSNLIAWMAARSDAPHYGEIIVYRFPKEKLVYGPMQIEARIDQDSEISQQFTLWGQRGVQVLRGNLLVIPIEDSLLYVEPVYLQAERGRIPELRRVVAAYEDRIVMRETLDASLREIFSGWGTSSPSARAARPGEAAAPGGKLEEAARRLGREAWEVFQRSRDAFRKGDWEAFGRAMKDLEESLKRLAKP
jgi:uncharacterized membrane protein (UPF0182 family)